MTILTEPRTSPDITVLETPTQTSISENMGIGAGLVAVAAESYYAEHSYLTQEMVQPLRAVIESGCHPVLGFGAAMAIMATQGEGFNLKNKLQLSTVLVAASIADLFTERMQDVVVQPTKAFYDYTHLPETAKDYAFAIGGAAMAVWANRKRTVQK